MTSVSRINRTTLLAGVFALALGELGNGGDVNIVWNIKADAIASEK